MSDETFIYLRHTVSGVTSAVTPEEAAHLLDHEWFKQFYEEVRSEKDLVLGRPYKLNGDGERVTLVQEKPIADDQFTSEETPDAVDSVQEDPAPNTEDKK